MSEMIDRGARAILDCAQGQTWAFTEQKPVDLTNVLLDGQFNLVEFAAAVIAAIREPTLFRDRFNVVDVFAVSMASVAGYAGHYWWVSGIFAVQLLINYVAAATGLDHLCRGKP